MATWKPKFIDVLSIKGSVTDAAKAAGITRQTAYQHRRTDEVFAKCWALAEEEVSDSIEREMWRRAVEGVDKPHYYKDQLVDTYKEYSDRLLIVLARARNPKRFTPEKRLEHSGAIGGQAQVVITIPDNSRDPDALGSKKTVIEGEAHEITKQLDEDD